jgi:ubiquitin-like 1-activating enzyme E1 B
MADMWRSRAPPTPLDFEGIREGRFEIPPVKEAATAPAPAVNGNGSAKMTNGDASTTANGTGTKLKDQQSLSLEENLAMFVSSTKRLSARLRSGEETISFDKDDDDTLDFVTSAANLRSAAYGIPRKTRWEVKEMAGNIIPAIATTNAIVAGLIVLQALQILRKAFDQMRSVHIQIKGNVPLSSSKTCGPSEACGVCRDTYGVLLCDPAKVTLGKVITEILGTGSEDEEDGEWERTGERDVSVYEDKRILSDPDFDDNLDRTLESLNVTRGTFLTIVDEDGEWGTISLNIGVLP